MLGPASYCASNTHSRFHGLPALSWHPPQLWVDPKEVVLVPHACNECYPVVVGEPFAGRLLLHLSEEVEADVRSHELLDLVVHVVRIDSKAHDSRLDGLHRMTALRHSAGATRACLQDGLARAAAASRHSERRCSARALRPGFGSHDVLFLCQGVVTCKQLTS